MLGEMNHSTPANEDPCQVGIAKARVGCQLMPKHSSEHNNIHVKIGVDSNTHNDALKDVYVPEGF